MEELLEMNENKKKSVNQVENFDRRIKALRRLQVDLAELDGQFSLQVLKLEEKYEKKMVSIFAKRRDILNGDYEPTVADRNYPLTYVDIPPKEEKDEEEFQGIIGVPVFWLTVFNNVPLFWSTIQRQDIEPLMYLEDIICCRNIKPDPGFTLFFRFKTNKYFSDPVLTKQYILQFGSKDNDPFNTSGPEMIKCIGCDIHWTKQDLTLNIQGKKLIKRPSFFNFFDPPNPSDADSKLEPYISNYLLTDYQMGFYLKEKIIPNAVLYYLGEAVLRENFGFEPSYIKEEILNEEEKIPSIDTKTLIEDSDEKLKEMEQKQWEKSEKKLAKRIAMSGHKKADNFEEGKVKMNNIAFKAASSAIDKDKIAQLTQLVNENKQIKQSKKKKCKSDIFKNSRLTQEKKTKVTRKKPIEVDMNEVKTILKQYKLNVPKKKPKS